VDRQQLAEIDLAVAHVPDRQRHPEIGVDAAIPDSRHVWPGDADLVGDVLIDQSVILHPCLKIHGNFSFTC
jgi:hypothetical protein